MPLDFTLPPHVKLIGLLGGIASGKSFVARLLEELGAVRLDADRAGHEVLRLPEVEAAARARWGDEVFTPGGGLDRSAIAKRVFGSSPTAGDDLAFLEKLTHPRIAERLREQAQACVDDGATVLILDAPVMMKAGWDRFCTHLLFIESTLEQRQKRAAERGWKPGELAAREALQEPLEEKRRRAGLLVDNTGTAEFTKSQVARLWSTIRD